MVVRKPSEMRKVIGKVSSSTLNDQWPEAHHGTATMPSEHMNGKVTGYL